MLVKQETLTIQTRGRGTKEVTSAVNASVTNSEIMTGICQVFVTHTSASLILCENADPDVRSDLETYMSKVVRDGDPAFVHTIEGPDDMPAHIRTVLTQNTISVPIQNQRCALGTWQGIYLWEHRTRPHRRQLIVTVMGTKR